MMAEDFIDIVDRTGNPTGRIAPKSKIHREGHYHNTCHVWFYTKGGRILLQQRAATKLICPLLWDVSVAGHIDAGETPEIAAVRETEEEIGAVLLESELIKIGVFECFQSYANGIIDNEFHHTFIAEIADDLERLTPQKDEVEALKFVSLDTFQKLLEDSSNNGHFVPSNNAYYLKVLEAIKSELRH